MSQSRTRVRGTTVRNHAPLAQVQTADRLTALHMNEPIPSSTENATKPLGFGERMLRNTAICVALLLCVLAAQSLNTPSTTKATNLLSQIVSMDLSESLGSLRFVSNLIPESVSVFWNLAGERHRAPSNSSVVHVFSQLEPWISYSAGETHASAAGEVMSLSADPAGRSVIRIRHASGMESLYGNLLRTSVREGDWVELGDVIGAAKELTYELRGEGRAMDPVPYFR